MVSNPGWRGSLGEGHGTPLQYSCLENPMDRAAWQAMVHRFTKSQRKQATEHARLLGGWPPAFSPMSCKMTCGGWRSVGQ